MKIELPERKIGENESKMDSSLIAVCPMKTFEGRTIIVLPSKVFIGHTAIREAGLHN